MLEHIQFSCGLKLERKQLKSDRCKGTGSHCKIQPMNMKEECITAKVKEKKKE
jgi:hypothetical protein